MKRMIVLALALAACHQTSRNFVCERAAAVEPRSTCTPETPERARVTIGLEQLSCVLRTDQVSVACAPLFMSAQKPAPKQNTTPLAEPAGPTP